MNDLDQRILSILEEFRWDNVFALLNTVIDATGSSEEIINFGKAVSELLSRGHVAMTTKAFFPANPETLSDGTARQVIASFPDIFEYDVSRMCWTLKGGDLKTARIPVINVTTTGLEMARNILERRGYQWWRSRKP